MAFNIFERWPWTSFQNLNLDWLMKAVKEAGTKADEASTTAAAIDGKATEALATANQASDTASEAIELARTANELLYIFDHGENKAQNFVKYVEGETVYISAVDIFTAITGDHKLPVFMDRNNYIYDMAGFETNPENPLEVTRFRFIRDGGDRQHIVWIDRNANITYTTAYTGDGSYPVTFNFIPNNPELDHSNYWDTDKTYSEIYSAIQSGANIKLTVKYNGQIRDIINGAHIQTGNNTIYFGYSKGVSEVSPMDGYTNSIAYFTIDENDFVTQRGIHYVPPAGTVNLGKVLTVGSTGQPEWLPSSLLPAVTAADNGKFLRVVSGAWTAATSDSEPVITVNDDTIQMNINPNTLYIFPNAGQLTVTPANPVAGVVNEYHFLFYSGATATTLTLPSTIRQPDGFTVEANHWYEVSILENNMLAYGWAVTP